MRYLPRESAERGEPQPPPVAVATTYDAGRRVLELKFAAPLERFRTVEVELGEGILATDERPLAPWRLRFTVGGIGNRRREEGRKEERKKGRWMTRRKWKLVFPP